MMFRELPDIKTPPDETIIWRYMKLEHVLALIAYSRLRLSRFDSFQDPWEGRWPKAIADRYPRTSSSPSKIGLLLVPEFYRESLFANCWHVSNHESAALWHLYSSKSGIAIKSTIARLKASLLPNEEPDFFIGEVQYKDFKTETVALSSLLGPFLKRKSFEYEREVRVVIFDAKSQSPKKDAHYLSCETSVLIEALYLSPECDEFMKSLLETLLDKFDIGMVPVICSTLYDTSVY